METKKNFVMLKKTFLSVFSNIYQMIRILKNGYNDCQFFYKQLRMKLTFLFLLLYGLSAEALPRTNLIPSAVSQIIREFYNKRSVRFDFIIYDTQGSEWIK